MDGNNRWSKKNNLTKLNSYKYGANNLIKITNHIFNKYKIKHVSAFALSKNNLGRSKKTIEIILKILDEYLNKTLNNSENFKLNFVGDLSFLNKNIRDKIIKVEKLNKNKKKNLTIFINYGGQEDIINAINTTSTIRNIDKFKSNLITKDLPNPDMIIRTGGFQRISNFMLFEIAFTELFFTKKLWPNLNISDIDKFISKFQSIERKFGI